MSRDKQIEEMQLTEVDILANDLNQHCADLAENYCGGVSCLTCLAHALNEKGYRRTSDVAEEIIAIIEQRISMNEERYRGVSNEVWQSIYKAREHAYKDLKEIIEQKYTESEGADNARLG